jgi:selenide,water dikinase
MERSQQLGHCICNVQRPCPCDVLRDQNICPCAGERPDPVDLSKVKLTELARNAGCASKIAPAELDAVLGRLPEVKDARVISGLAAGDDAAIYRISDDVTLVQTVDVFTPCVDDAHLFGRICASNCLSDVYAMGGEPRTALSILGFPSETLPGEVMYQMLVGAMEIFKEAGVALIGGHSIKDEEVKLGFAITGLIKPAVAESLEQPAAGDVLVLTKPLGTGVLTFARQIGRGHPEGLAAAEASMAALNKAAAEAMKEAGATACTDVTGFGLFAHLLRMLRPSKLGAEIQADALPAFDGVIEAFREGIVPGAVERNREYVGDAIRIGPEVDEALVHLGYDAQTSGGLLIAIPAGRLEILRRFLSRRGVSAFVIGKITSASGVTIQVTASTRTVKETPKTESRVSVKDALKTEPPVGVKEVPTAASPVSAKEVPKTAPSVGAKEAPKTEPAVRAKEARITDPTVIQLLEKKGIGSPAPDSTAPDDGCCKDAPKSATVPGSALESQKGFAAMMRSVQAAGALSEKVKEQILFSLIVYSRCHPCFDALFQKVREMGITQAELDEAAWCAIAMGGAPVRLFYQESLERAQKSAVKR